MSQATYKEWTWTVMINIQHIHTQRQQNLTTNNSRMSDPTENTSSRTPSVHAARHIA